MNEKEMIKSGFTREQGSVPGPFYVTCDTCIACGLPPETAPKNVKLRIDTKNPECLQHCQIYKQPNSEEELESMFEAMHGSCVEAIRYCGTDPEIIDILKQRGMAHLCDAIPENELPRRNFWRRRRKWKFWKK